MYTMPEKQSGSRMVLNCTRSCFYQYANHLPNHLLSIELKYPDFFLPLFDLIRFILYYFVQAELFHANLRFQKEKNFEETLCLQPRQFVFYFASLTLICKLLFIRRISLETKISILNSQMLAFWGTPFILAIKILKAKLQTFHSNVLMRES